MIPFLILFIILIIVIIFSGKYCTKNYLGADRRFYDDPYQVFPSLQSLSDNFETIEKEYLAGEYRIYDWPEEYLYQKEKGHDWKVVPLYGFGIWNKQYTHNFPETIKLLKQIPRLKTAIFSKLGPDTELTKHRGWASLANSVLRCHMGIIVPDPITKGRSGVEVEDEFRQIKKGEWCVFDDSKTHIGINKSKENRVVLLLDIERPWWVKKGESTVENTPELKKFIDKFTT